MPSDNVKLGDSHRCYVATVLCAVWLCTLSSPLAIALLTEASRKRLSEQLWGSYGATGKGPKMSRGSGLLASQMLEDLQLGSGVQ